MIATLGRYEDRRAGGQLQDAQASGQLERLLRSGARFAEQAMVLGALDDDMAARISQPTHRARPGGTRQEKTP